MLKILVPLTSEDWDEEKEEFIDPIVQPLELEHSLVSISKWESKWHKPFLSKREMTDEETIDYVKCMTLTHNIDPEVYSHLTPENIAEINDYIGSPMTATTFSEEKSSKSNREIITSEVIYYWMVALNIPSEYQYWHINRLLTLVRICNIKNQPRKKKRSLKEITNDYASINAARRKKLNTNG